jgi:hypothetical protein
MVRDTRLRQWRCHRCWVIQPSGVDARVPLIHHGDGSCATARPLPVHEIESAKRLPSGGGQAVFLGASQQNRPEIQVPPAGVGNPIGRPALLDGCRSDVSSIKYALLRHPPSSGTRIASECSARTPGEKSVVQSLCSRFGRPGLAPFREWRRG